MSTQMNIKKGKRDSSQDGNSDVSSIEEETFEDLKCFENSPLRIRARKVAEAARAKSKAKEAALATAGDNNTKDRDNTRNNSNIMVNDVEGPILDTRKHSYITGNDDEEPMVDPNDGNHSLTEEIKNVTNAQTYFEKFRDICGRVVNNPTSKRTIVVMILVNAIMMGIATYPIPDEMKDRFDRTDVAFLIIFTIELALQFIVHGFGLLSDGWLVFDLIVISISWGFFWIEGVELQVIRVFRAFRLVTRVKIMKDLILALLSVLPRMGAIFLMLLLIFYIFAVMFTTHFNQHLYDDEQCNDASIVNDYFENLENCNTVPIEDYYFANLGSSMLTLFQLMTMDEWADIVRSLMPCYPVTSWLYLIIFVIISGFIVVNLIVAVICDAIGALDEKEKAKFHGHANGNANSGTDTVKLRDQMEIFEDQIGDLTRIQARTFHTLQYLTQELRMEKEKSMHGATADAAASKTAPSPPEDKDRGNPEEKKEKGSSMLKRRLSGNMSRRGSFNQPGYTDRRKSYRDTWTQEGSDKSLRRAVVSNFAKSARQLQKMRERDESLDTF